MGQSNSRLGTWRWRQQAPPKRRYLFTDGIKPYLLRPESSSTLLWKPHTLKSMSDLSQFIYSALLRMNAILPLLEYLDKVWHVAHLLWVRNIRLYKICVFRAALLKTRVSWGVMQCLLVYCCGSSDGPQCRYFLAQVVRKEPLGSYNIDVRNYMPVDTAWHPARLKLFL